MVVLDPDHPLMRRFQNVLRTQLENQNEKITLELKDLLETLKARKADREDAAGDRTACLSYRID